jgi:hypothetical protein
VDEVLTQIKLAGQGTNFVRLTQLLGAGTKQIALSEKVTRLVAYIDGAGADRTAIRLVSEPPPADWYYVAETIDNVLSRIKLAGQDTMFIECMQLVTAQPTRQVFLTDGISRMVGYTDGAGADRTAIRVPGEADWFYLDENIDDVLPRIKLAGQGPKLPQFTQLLGGATNQLVVQSSEVRGPHAYAGGARTIIRLQGEPANKYYYLDEQLSDVVTKLKLG